MFHVKRWWLLLETGVVLACGVPDDELFSPTAVEPVEISPGLYRMTFGTGPDFVRGFTADGERILYRSRGQDTASSWRILSVPLAGGSVREEALLYRTALRQPVSTLAMREGERTLGVWTHPPLPWFSCVCLPLDRYPTVTGLSVYWLGETDGSALSALPVHSTTFFAGVRFDSVDTVEGVNVFGDTLRTVFAQQDPRSLAADPFGPVLSPDGATMIFSDGDVLWRVPRSNPQTKDSVGPGAFPALSAGGRWLAAAVPADLDSTVTFCVLTLPDNVECHQRLFHHTASGWLAVLYDLENDSSVVVGSGAEPVPDMSRGRVLVRRFDGLYWIDVAGGTEQLIEGSSGAYATALSPFSDAIAFSADLFGNPDVFLLWLE